MESISASLKKKKSDKEVSDEFYFHKTFDSELFFSLEIRKTWGNEKFNRTS